MYFWINRFLSPPIFTNDEDKTRASLLLNSILLSLLGCALIFRVVLWLQHRTPPRIPLLWSFIVLLVGMIALMRFGHVRLASFLTSAGLWTILILSALLNGGLRSTEFGTLIIPVLIVGLLLGRGATLVTTGLSILAGLFMWWASNNGLIPLQGGVRNSLNIFMVQGISFLAAAFLVMIAKGRLESALERVSEELNERKRLEAQQKKSQQQYEALVQSIDGIVWEINPKTFEFTFVSQQAERLLGYPLAQWHNEANFWVNHLHPDDQQWAVAYIAAATERKENYQFEYRMIAADRRVVWIRDMVTVCMLDDNTMRLRGVMVDFTERMQAEEALRISKNRYRKIIELAPEAITVLDVATCKFIDFNPQALALFDLSETKIGTVGPVEMSPLLQPDGRTSSDAAKFYLKQALVGEIPIFDWLHCNAKGEFIPCEVRLLQLPDESRQLVLARITDLSKKGSHKPSEQ